MLVVAVVVIVITKSIWARFDESDSLCHLLKWMAFIIRAYLKWMRPNELLKRIPISWSVDFHFFPLVLFAYRPKVELNYNNINKFSSEINK